MSYESVHFDSIEVIESLRPREQRTGEQLCQKLFLPAEQHQVRLTLHTPATKDELHDVLLAIAEKTERDGGRPIVHLEAHGDALGIALTSGEAMDWEELRLGLTRINRASKLNLLVVMAVCWGGHLVSILKPTYAAPVLALVGPADKIPQYDLLHDFPAFYRSLLLTLDGRKALEALNGAPLGSQWRYSFTTARLMFRLVFHGYATDCCTADAIKERSRLIAEQFVADNPGQASKRDEVAAWAAKHLQDLRGPFAHFKDRFFMLNQFPEHRTRFDLDLEACLRNPLDDAE
jgi:hypothetical protein